MALMIKAVHDGDFIDIDSAIQLRDEAKRLGYKPPLFYCTECGKRVKAHISGGHTNAHFEHLKRNSNCSQSHKI